MFDFDAGKLLIVGIIALIFIPPKDLPRVLRQVGQFVGKMKRMASDFQGQFMDAMREADMADLRREAQKLAESTKADVGLGSVHDLRRDLEMTPASSRPVPTLTPRPAFPPPVDPASVAQAGVAEDGADKRVAQIEAGASDHVETSAARSA